MDLETLIGMPLGIALGLAYATHIFRTLQDRLPVMLLIGVIIFPVGMINGVRYWFGGK
ncbi:MAG: hypothetical protein ACOVKC_10185 [Brevundimonas sp.]